MRPLLACFSLLCALLMAAPLLAQSGEPAPTLVPPTLVPSVAGAPQAALPTASAVAQIHASNIFKVGILYNAPPYSALTLQGEMRGFDVELLRLLAAEWGCELEFLQVTRQNAVNALVRGEVHAVATALAHYRDASSEVEFTQPYQIGSQVLLVRESSDYAAPNELANQAVGYVLGSRAETALELWRQRAGITLEPRRYLNLDRAFAALVAGEVEAIVGETQALLRAVGDYGELARLLEAPILQEPRAFAVRRHDFPLRQLLNRSIQLLAQQQKLQLLHREFFPDEAFPETAVTLWDGIGDEVSPMQFTAQIEYQQQYRLSRLFSSRVLRVGGISHGAGAESAAGARLSELHLALAREIAARWGLQLELVPSAAAEAATLLAAGAADLMLGLKPDWGLIASGIEFSSPYLLHGDRLMTRKSAGIRGFSDLRGRIIGILIGDDGAQARAQAWADSINASVRFFLSTESGAALTLLDYNNANAIYADSLALIPHLQANPDRLQVTTRWYSRGYYAAAISANDPDFRRLLNYTLQEMKADGTLFALAAPLLLSDELPAFAIVPGPAIFSGISLARV